MLEGALHAVVLTLAIEVPLVAAVFFRRGHLRMAAVCAATTAVTNLTMNVLLIRIVSGPDQFLWIGELSALLIEASVYALLSRPRDTARAIIASALANGASFAAGIFLFV